MPLHIALDLDDVVLDFVSGVCETVSRDFGCTITKDDITDWQFGQFLNHHIGRDWWEWLEDHSWLWGEKFRPVQGALGSIEKLRRAGHYLEIVTVKPEWAEDQVWIWLGRYKPRVHQVTILPARQEVNKSDATNADVLVDDKFENCVDFARSGRTAILFPAPHNADPLKGKQFSTYGDSLEILPSGVFRATDWNNVLELIALEEQGILWPEEDR